MSKERAKRIIDGLMPLAEHNLKKDGALCPIGFVFHHDQMLAPIVLKATNKEEQHSGFVFLGAVAKNMLGDAVLILNDIAFKQYNHENPAIDKDGRIIDETELPLSYPESMRTDAIMLQFIDLTDRSVFVSLKPYKKHGDSFEFQPTIEHGDGMMGAVQDSVFYGYDNSEKLPNVQEVFKNLPKR